MQKDLKKHFMPKEHQNFYQNSNNIIPSTVPSSSTTTSTAVTACL
jgi:hypothetical protein